MNDYEKIEQLLNSYIDSELDERKSTEVKRLIDHDPEVRAVYESLNRCRKLVENLPGQKAPANTCREITEKLERQMLLAGAPEAGRSGGTRHLIVRRIMAAAATLVLMAGLGFIVFDIFVPKSSRKKIVSNLSKQRQSQVLYERPFADEAKTEPTKTVQAVEDKGPQVPVSAELTFGTSSPIQVDMFIGKAILNHRLFAKTTGVVRSAKAIYYELKADEDELVSLLEDLQILWQKSDDVTLAVETESFGEYITVERLSPAQAMDIFTAESYNRRVRLAKDFARINAVVPGETEFEKFYTRVNDIDLELFTAPRPIMTAPQRQDQTQREETADNARLKIIVKRRL